MNLKIHKLKNLSLVCCVGLMACSDNNTTGDGYEVFEVPPLSAFELQTIESPFPGGKTATYKWVIEDTLNSNYALTNVNSPSVELVAMPGNYVLTLQMIDGSEVRKGKAKVAVKQTPTSYSPYINKVYDFLPAPGQFTNDLPKHIPGETHEDMIRKAEQSISGDVKKTSLISLGGFGGYVVFGFDHTIINVEGKCDFRVMGNAFYADANPNPEAPQLGGSCEPGVIMVAYDKNKNGKPDEDEWYEIAGSEYKNPKTIHNYEITYYCPETEEGVESKETYVTIKDYLYWEDNQGNSGYKEKNMYHHQSYYPQWINQDEITFKGTLLPLNAIDESGKGTYWVLYAFDYGYADNIRNAEDGSAIDIGWAVDANGNKVNLPGIDFVKVYTGLNQECGWLGETSTEIMGAEDLHLLNKSIETRN